jgi:hypothetical protein
MAFSIPVVWVVDRALRDAGIPISGAAVGDEQDRATWRVHYQPSATPAQRAQGDQILATIDPQDPTTVQNIKNDLSTTRANDELIRAVVQGLYEAIPNPPVALDTLAKLRARILQIYRGLV